MAPPRQADPRKTESITLNRAEKKWLTDQGERDGDVSWRVWLQTQISGLVAGTLVITHAEPVQVNRRKRSSGSPSVDVSHVSPHRQRAPKSSDRSREDVPVRLKGVKTSKGKNQ